MLTLAHTAVPCSAESISRDASEALADQSVDVQLESLGLYVCVLGGRSKLRASIHASAVALVSAYVFSYPSDGFAYLSQAVLNLLWVSHCSSWMWSSAAQATTTTSPSWTCRWAPDSLECQHHQPHSCMHAYLIGTMHHAMCWYWSATHARCQQGVVILIVVTQVCSCNQHYTKQNSWCVCDRGGASTLAKPEEPMRCSGRHQNLNHLGSCATNFSSLSPSYTRTHSG